MSHNLFQDLRESCPIYSLHLRISLAFLFAGHIFKLVGAKKTLIPAFRFDEQYRLAFPVLNVLRKRALTIRQNVNN